MLSIFEFDSERELIYDIPESKREEKKKKGDPYLFKTLPNARMGIELSLRFPLPQAFL